MVKLQRIKRSNDTYVYSVNIPLSLIEELDWKKGSILSVETGKVRVNSCLIIEMEDNDNGRNY